MSESDELKFGFLPLEIMCGKGADDLDYLSKALLFFFFFTLGICGLTDDVHLGKFLPWILAAVGLLTGFPKARLTLLFLGRYCRQT